VKLRRFHERSAAGVQKDGTKMRERFGNMRELSGALSIVAHLWAALT
jgi:hypothetical protein